ncbi:MAG: hypothetical protein O3B01_02720 [Planctomycetota bacterium]|nr:hypothetical protein [Planctomycetota bacterium]
MQFLLLGLVVLAFSIRKVASLDVWWHLASGRWIVENGAIPKVDVFSFAIEGAPWINVWWGFQTVQYLAFQWVGLDGLIILKSLLILSAFGIACLTVPRTYRGSFLVFVCLLGVIISQLRFHIRPTAASYVFLTAYIFILEQDLIGRKHWLWSLLPLHLVWANFHGVSVVGIVLLLIYAGSEFWRIYGWQPNSWRGLEHRPGRQFHFSGAAAGCFLISFLTPYGVDGVKYCWGQYFWMNSAEDPAFLLLTELWPPFGTEMAVHPITSFCYWAFSIITALTFVFNRRKLRISDIVLYVAFFHLFHSAMRNAVLFALVAIPIAARNFGTWMEGRVSTGCDSKSLEEEGHRKQGLQIQLRALFKDHYRHLAQIAVGLLAIVLIIDICSGKFYRRERGDFEFGLGVQSGLFPEGTVEEMSKLPKPSRLFNDFDFGGYLIWKLSPGWQVFVDNRILVYGDVIRRYSRSRGYPAKFFELVEEYDMQYALLKHTDSSNAPLLRELARNKEWHVLAYDEVGVLFGRGHSRQELMHAWRDEKPVSGNLWSFSRRLTRLGRLFENMNRPALAEEAYKLAQPDRWHNAGDLAGRDVYTPAFVNFAEHYLATGQELRALPYLEKAVYWDTRTLEKLYAIKGRWGELHARLGYLYYRAGARDKAKRALSIAIKESPDDESSTELLNQLR